ncbi:Zinc finger protein RFP [Varanus komodoensis]|nr:Zinc finger protein RFP [Varanus komodoensis]
MAAGRGAVQDLCDEVTCPICLEYFKDAVTVAECGHSFCRACLPQCGGKAGGEASCPQCRGIFRRSSLLPNRQLSNFVEIAKKLTSAGEGGEGRFCERHWEPLKLFCADHGAPVCLVCCRSKEHEGHKLVPLEEAARKDEELISSSLELLRNEQQHIWKYKDMREKESQDLLVRVILLISTK